MAKGPPNFNTAALYTALHKAADALKLKKYKINLNLHLKTPGGFSGEFLKPSITNSITGEEIKCALKRAPESQEQRQRCQTTFCYNNEIHFYKNIYPALQQFEEQHKVSQLLNVAPEYICSVGSPGEEIVVLKDITQSGYEMRDSRLLFDDEHTRLIFEKYANFHAISFCLKKQQPKKFKELEKQLVSVWEKMNASQCKGLVASAMRAAYDDLSDEEDEVLKEKFRKYMLSPKDIFGNAISYNGNYAGILHGDCWSNNMMFKYKHLRSQKILEEVKFIDYQMTLIGTPAFDLSFSFYSGCDAKLFNNIEDYLDVYYKKFTKTASNLGENAEKLYPRVALSLEFQRYAKLGMMLAIYMVKIKLMDEQECIKLRENLKMKKPKISSEIKVDKQLVKKRTTEIIRHVGQINAL